MSYTITVDDGGMGGRFKGYRGRLDPAKIAEVAGRYMALDHLPEMFQEGGEVGGAKWAQVRRGGRPLWDTGELAGNFFYRVVGTRAEIMNHSPYAITHDQGLTITPRSGKFLAIPLSPPLNVTERRTMKPRQFKNTFVARSRNGNLIVFQTVRKPKGKDKGEIRPLFLLKSSVKITQRRFMYWSEDAIQGTVEDVQAYVAYSRGEAAA